MKILFVNPSASLGGGNTISNSLALGLNKDFFEVFSFFPEEGESVEQIEKEIKVILPYQKGLFSIVKFLRGFIKQNNIDIVHAHGTRAAFWARLAVVGLKNRPKIIYTLHGLHIVRKNLLIRWILVLMERFLNRWTDILVCVSEADKNLVLKYKTIPPKKIKVIKNGIDIEKFNVKPERLEKTKEKLGLKNEFIISSIARLHPPKDVLTVLKALKLIVNEVKDIKLLIIGDGPLRESLEKETQNLNLENYVMFLGYRQDIPELIGISDVVVLSTNWEGLPLIPLETGASKKPVIASDVDGVREVVIDGKTGFLFKPGSDEDLAEKILKLYRNEDLRKKLGENGFDFVSENFNLNKMIKEYENLYKDIL